MDLYDLKIQWRKVIEHKGGNCPVCDCFGKIYRVKITWAMVRSLAWMSVAHHKMDKDGWIHIPTQAPKFVTQTYQFANMARWDLIERKLNENTNKRTSGVWRLTPKGRAFLNNQLAIPEAVFLYNDKVDAFAERLVFAKNCAKESFDYQELMDRCFVYEAKAKARVS